MSLALVAPNDPILHEPCDKFDFRNPQVDIANFGKALVKFMYDNNGIGLSANQVGYPYQIFAMRGSPENYVGINPRIVEHSEDYTTLQEGCLSYPKLIVKVKRYSWVSVRMFGPDGSAKTHRFEGISSHVVQHEMAHLEGRTFFDDCNFIAKEKAKKDWKKLCR